MITSATNDLYYSTCLYVDHQILQRGSGFTNHSSLLYPQIDPVLPNNTVYASPFKQWVYDYSVSGANVPSGVYINNVFCQKGVSGLKIDYMNGRVILSGGSQYQNLTVSGNYSVKDFNIYPTTKSNEELIYETKYELRPSYNKTLSGVSKNALVVPGIFITSINFGNEPFEFGGLAETTANIHCVILADSIDQLNAVGNIIMDQKSSYFPVLSKTPLNYYGDFKTGNYNYLEYIGNPTSSGLAYIADADFYKLSDKNFSDKYPDLKFGMSDLEIKLVRLPNKSII